MLVVSLFLSCDFVRFGNEVGLDFFSFLVGEDLNLVVVRSSYWLRIKVLFSVF